MIKIVIKLIDALKTIHESDRTYNDLKPENIMLDGEDVKLIGFDFVDKFSEGQETQYVEVFRGNFMLASVNQLEFKKTSRKDDLISLAYLLIYMVNGKKMPFLNQQYDDQ